MIIYINFCFCSFFFFQAEDGIRDIGVTGVQTCALPIWGNKVTYILLPNKNIAMTNTVLIKITIKIRDFINDNVIILENIVSKGFEKLK